MGSFPARALGWELSPAWLVTGSAENVTLAPAGDMGETRVPWGAARAPSAAVGGEENSWVTSSGPMTFGPHTGCKSVTSAFQSFLCSLFLSALENTPRCLILFSEIIPIV